MTKQDQAQETGPAPIIDPARCTGCGLCVQVCPTGALAMHGRTAVVARGDACDYTGHCARICPARAISLSFQIGFAAKEAS